MTERERSRLVEENLGLVYKIVQNSCYQDAAQRSVYFDSDDLIQEGSMALIRAAETYDETCGTRFSTYAWHVIDNALKDYLRMDERHNLYLGERPVSLNYCKEEDVRTLESHIPVNVDFDKGMNLMYMENAVREIAKDGSDLSIYADIFLKMMIEGYSYEELCEDYGISVRKAYKGKERLIARIRKKKAMFARLCGAYVD